MFPPRKYFSGLDKKVKDTKPVGYIEVDIQNFLSLIIRYTDYNI